MWNRPDFLQSWPCDEMSIKQRSVTRVKTLTEEQNRERISNFECFFLNKSLSPCFIWSKPRDPCISLKYHQEGELLLKSHHLYTRNMSSACPWVNEHQTSINRILYTHIPHNYVDTKWRTRICSASACIKKVAWIDGSLQIASQGPSSFASCWSTLLPTCDNLIHEKRLRLLLNTLKTSGVLILLFIPMDFLIIICMHRLHTCIPQCSKEQPLVEACFCTWLDLRIKCCMCKKPCMLHITLTRLGLLASNMAIRDKTQFYPITSIGAVVHTVFNCGGNIHGGLLNIREHLFCHL